MIVNFRIENNCIYGEFENDVYLWGKISGKTIHWTNYGHSQLNKDTKNFIRNCILNNR